MISFLGMAKKKPFSLMPKNSQCYDVRTGESVSVPGDALRMDTHIACCHQIKTVLALTSVTASLCSAGSCCPPVMSLCNWSGLCMSECRGCAWRWFRSSRLANRKRRECGWREARSSPGAELACRQAAGTTRAVARRTLCLLQLAKAALPASGRVRR